MCNIVVEKALRKYWFYRKINSFITKKIIVTKINATVTHLKKTPEKLMNVDNEKSTLRIWF